MNFRLGARTGVAVTLGVIVANGFLSARTDAVASTTNQPTKWSVPRTRWGHPDLQGVWTSTGMRFVPFERARQLGTRDTLNDREFARRVASNPDRGVTITNANAERTAQVSRQASLVVEPADGRIRLTSLALEELKKR